MCNRVLLWFGKLPQWNIHINGTIFESDLRFQGCWRWNCHVNGTTFQSCLRFQTEGRGECGEEYCYENTRDDKYTNENHREERVSYWIRLKELRFYSYSIKIALKNLCRFVYFIFFNLFFTYFMKGLFYIINKTL